MKTPLGRALYGVWNLDTMLGYLQSWLAGGANESKFCEVNMNGEINGTRLTEICDIAINRDYDRSS